MDGTAADDELAAAGFNVLTSEGRLVPASVSSLGDVRSLAALVAGLVLALGVVTAIYAVTVTRRLGRREAGTLRALGLTPRALATTTEVQGLTIALVGVVIGLPVGVVVGRQRLVAHRRARPRGRPRRRRLGIAGLGGGSDAGERRDPLPPASVPRRPPALHRRTARGVGAQGERFTV